LFRLCLHYLSVHKAGVPIAAAIQHMDDDLLTEMHDAIVRNRSAKGLLKKETLKRSLKRLKGFKEGRPPVSTPSASKGGTNAQCSESLLPSDTAISDTEIKLPREQTLEELTVAAADARHLRSGVIIQWSQYPGVDDEHLTDMQKRERFAIINSGLLFSSYRPEYWHFEITNCFTKLALTCVVQFIEPGSVTQILATVGLAFGSVLLYCILHPMGSILAQTWKVVFSILLFVNLFLGYGMYNGNIDAEDPLWDWTLLLLNIATICIPVLLGVCLFSYAAFIRWKAAKRGKQVKKNRGRRDSLRALLCGYTPRELSNNEPRTSNNADDPGTSSDEDEGGLQGDELAF